MDCVDVASRFRPQRELVGAMKNIGFRVEFEIDEGLGPPKMTVCVGE